MDEKNKEMQQNEHLLSSKNGLSGLSLAVSSGERIIRRVFYSLLYVNYHMGRNIFLLLLMFESYSKSNDYYLTVMCLGYLCTSLPSKINMFIALELKMKEINHNYLSTFLT